VKFLQSVLYFNIDNPASYAHCELISDCYIMTQAK